MYTEPKASVEATLKFHKFDLINSFAMNKIITLLLLFSLAKYSSAQIIQQSFYAQIIYFDDFSNILNGAVELGDTITGTITYSENVSDANTDPTIGDYLFYDTPSGFDLQGPNGVTWKTDSSNVNFLVEAVNWEPVAGGDAIVFRSYNNTYSVGDIAADKVIAWQIDNPDGDNLNNDELPLVINLNAWDQVFALTIEANDFPSGDNYFIRANVYKISNEISTSVQSVNGESNISFYPNPCAAFINITNPQAWSELKIYDVNGNAVMNFSTLPKEVEVNSLNAGVYTMKIIGKNRVRIMKMIKI